MQTDVRGKGDDMRREQAPALRVADGRNLQTNLHFFMNSSHSSAVSRAREDECTYGEELCAVRKEGTYGKRRHCGRYIRHGDEDVLLCLRKKPPHGFHAENRGANTSNLR